MPTKDESLFNGIPSVVFPCNPLAIFYAMIFQYWYSIDFVAFVIGFWAFWYCNRYHLTIPYSFCSISFKEFQYIQEELYFLEFALVMYYLIAFIEMMFYFGFYKFSQYSFSNISLEETVYESVITKTDWIIQEKELRSWSASLQMKFDSAPIPLS